VAPWGPRPTPSTTSYDETIGTRGDGDGSIKVVFDAHGVYGQAARFYTARMAQNAFGFLGERVGKQHSVYLRRYYRVDVQPAYRMSVLLYKTGGAGNGQLGGTHNGRSPSAAPPSRTSSRS
jgi:hypothetical protein